MYANCNCIIRRKVLRQTVQIPKRSASKNLRTTRIQQSNDKALLNPKIVVLLYS